MRLKCRLAATIAIAATLTACTPDEPAAPLAVTVPAPEALTDLAETFLPCDAVRSAAALPTVAEQRDLPDGSCSWQGMLAETGGPALVVLRYENRNPKRYPDLAAWQAHAAEAVACTGDTVAIDAAAYAHKAACASATEAYVGVAADSFAFGVTVTDASGATPDHELLAAAAGILARAVDGVLATA